VLYIFVIKGVYMNSKYINGNLVGELASLASESGEVLFLDRSVGGQIPYNLSPSAIRAVEKLRAYLGEHGPEISINFKKTDIGLQITSIDTGGKLTVTNALRKLHTLLEGTGLEKKESSHHFDEKQTQAILERLPNPDWQRTAFVEHGPNGEETLGETHPDWPTPAASKAGLTPREKILKSPPVSDRPSPNSSWSGFRDPSTYGQGEIEEVPSEGWQRGR
jgi:hypothetical protein